MGGGGVCAGWWGACSRMIPRTNSAAPAAAGEWVRGARSRMIPGTNSVAPTAAGGRVGGHVRG